VASVVAHGTLNASQRCAEIPKTETREVPGAQPFSPRILIIDDEATVSAFLSWVSRGEDCSIKALTGREALTAIRESGSTSLSPLPRVCRFRRVAVDGVDPEESRFAGIWRVRHGWMLRAKGIIAGAATLAKRRLPRPKEAIRGC
jgi:hypothetical protein